MNFAALKGTLLAELDLLKQCPLVHKDICTKAEAHLQPFNERSSAVPDGFHEETKINDDDDHNCCSTRPNYKDFVGDLFKDQQCSLQLASAYSDFLSSSVQTIQKLDIFSNSKNAAGRFEYFDQDQMEFTCTAKGGFPTPTLSLYIGM
jgi:hypothetical protein